MVEIGLGDVVHVVGIGPVRIMRARRVPGPPNPQTWHEHGIMKHGLGVPLPDIIYLDGEPAGWPAYMPGTPEALCERLSNRTHRIDGSGI